jgi:adenylosuccinate lyase
MAESVMIELTKRGMARQEAHEIIRVKSMEALAAKKSLADLLGETSGVTKILSPGEIEDLLNPDQYLGTSVLQVDRVVAKLAPLCS